MTRLNLHRYDDDYDDDVVCDESFLARSWSMSYTPIQMDRAITALCESRQQQTVNHKCHALTNFEADCNRSTGDHREYSTSEMTMNVCRRKICFKPLICINLFFTTGTAAHTYTHAHGQSVSTELR